MYHFDYKFYFSGNHTIQKLKTRMSHTLMLRSTHILKEKYQIHITGQPQTACKKTQTMKVIKVV